MKTDTPGKGPADGWMRGSRRVPAERSRFLKNHGRRGTHGEPAITIRA